MACTSYDTPQGAWWLAKNVPPATRTCSSGIRVTVRLALTVENGSLAGQDGIVGTVEDRADRVGTVPGSVNTRGRRCRTWPRN